MPFPQNPPSGFSTLPCNTTPTLTPLRLSGSSTRPLSGRPLADNQSAALNIPSPVTPPRSSSNLHDPTKRSSSPCTPRGLKRSRRAAPSPSPVTSKPQYLSPLSPTITTYNFSPLLFPTGPRPGHRHLQRPTTDMSFLSTLQPNFLSAKVDLTFDNEGKVEMVGGPNTGTTYSLPGHVLIAVPALPSTLDGKVRAIRHLVIKVEGKSEFFDEEGRYTPMRLFAHAIRLASKQHPLLIPAQDPARPRSSHVHLAVPFDLRLPGWLPPTFLADMTNTSYGCMAEMQVSWLDGTLRGVKPKTLVSNPSLNPAASTRSSSKFTEFTVRRHRIPMTINGRVPERAERHFTLRPGTTNNNSPIECILTVPEWVDINGEEKSLRVSLRIRARRQSSSALGSEVEQAVPAADDLSSMASSPAPEGVSEMTSAQVNDVSEATSTPMERSSACCVNHKPSNQVLVCMKELGMEVEEVERFTSHPLPTFTSLYPVPVEQPSRGSIEHSLISPRPIYASSAFLGTPNDSIPFRGLRTRQCLLAEDGNQRNFTFDDEGLALGDMWRKVNVVLPMPNIAKRGDPRNGGRPKAEMDSPFLRIKQILKVRLVCRHPGVDQDTVIVLSTPIRFGTTLDTVPDARPETYLPAYVQLFHENGDLRECDPLPVYTKHAEVEVEEGTSEEIAPVPDYKSLYPTAPSRPISPSSSYRSPSPSTTSTSDTDTTDSETSFSGASSSSWFHPGTGLSKAPIPVAFPAIV